MNQRTLNILVAVLLVGIVGLSSLTVIQQSSYQNLDSQYQEVLSEYEGLESLYEQALEDYETVYGQYQSKVAEYDQLNMTYTVLLTTHYALMESFGNTAQSLLDTTLELVALNQTYLDLLADFEELNMTYYILTGEYDTLNATYLILLQQHNQLNTTYFDLLGSYDVLQGEYNSLNVTYYQLLSEHENLQADYDQLLSEFNTLQGEYDQLLTDYTQLQADHDALQNDYNNLWLNYNTLWAAHQALQNDYDTLQGNYDVLQSQYNQLQTNYDSLEQDYLNLQFEYDTLDAAYWILQGEYDACVLELTQLQADYDSLMLLYIGTWNAYEQLQDDYDALLVSFTIIGDWLSQQILPVKASYFGEAVRRYYQPIYLEEAWNQGTNAYWTNFTKFMSDVVYWSSAWRSISGGSHGPWSAASASGSDYNKFLYVENLVIDALGDGWFDAFGLSYLPMRDLWGLSGWMMPVWNNGTHDIEIFWGDDTPWVDNMWECPFAIHQWVVDNIDYEYDSDIIYWDSWRDWDYIKFPVETAFRTMGDCEDQAILDAAFLRSCGFEIAMGTFHDNNHPVYGPFYHGILWINLDLDGNGVVDSYENTPENEILWHLAGGPEGYTWLLLDPTSDVPFGQTPLWLQHYIDNGITTFGSDRMHQEILTRT